MENISFFSVDIFIVIVIALSFIIGWVRGATKEILAVVAWIGGIYLSISLFPHAKELTRLYINHKLIADFATACGLFVLFLTILSVFNYFCSNLIKKSMLNTTDKALGGIFGIIRGTVILAVLDLVINQCMMNETPKWIENSKLRPTINSVSNFIILVLPENVQDKLLSHMSQLKKQSLLDFVKDDIIDSIAPNTLGEMLEKSSKHKVIAKNANLINEKEENFDDEFIEDEEITLDKNQTAEELATLKPKKLIVEKNEKEITKKERNDMDRLLDQYDDVDED